MIDSPAAGPFAFGARRRDFFVIFILSALILILSPRLRVYYAYSVAELSLIRVEPDGGRQSQPLPAGFTERLSRKGPPSELLKILDCRIHTFMNASDWMENAPPGSRWEWTISYSLNSDRLDRRKSIPFETPAKTAPTDHHHG